jgi:predicted PhzF superfamily epimerase YddE/YHI9
MRVAPVIGDILVGGNGRNGILRVLHVLRVFTDERGDYGNPLGVFLDGAEVSKAERQPIATELAFSETVFVDDASTGEIQIFTPAAEIPFAGHPTVGTGWLLAEAGRPVDVLRPPPGEVPVRRDGEMTYVSAAAEWCPDFLYTEHADAATVEALNPLEFDRDTFNWAWIDRDAGRMRARGFYPRHAIVEDEATGSAALALSVELDRPIDVLQGEGSQIIARPIGNGWGEIGGRVTIVERREH